MPRGAYDRNTIATKPIPLMSEIWDLYGAPESQVIEKLIEIGVLQLPTHCLECGKENAYRFKC